MRAVPDPHYGLPVVVCPKCERASVRTRHPDIEFWRGFRRTRAALQVVFAKTMGMLWCSIMFGMMIVESEELFNSHGHLDVLGALFQPDRLDAASAAGMLVMSVVFVLIARLLMFRERLIVPMLILMILTLVVVCFDFTIGTIGTLLADLGGFRSRHSIPREADMTGRFQRFGIFAAVGMLGLLIAPIFTRSLNRPSAGGVRRLLKKRRKQRATND